MSSTEKVGKPVYPSALCAAGLGSQSHGHWGDTRRSISTAEVA
jgi:hypothetical protein